MSFTAVANSDSVAAQTADADTRLSFATGTDGKGLKASWTTDDQLDVYVGSVAEENSATFSCESIAQDGTAVFTGTFPQEPQVGDKIYAYYKYGKNYWSSHRYRLCDFSFQSGYMEQLTSQCLMYAETTYSENMSLQFKHLYSVLKLTFKFPDEVASGTVIDEVGLTAKSGLYSSICYDANNNNSRYDNASSAASSICAYGLVVGSNHTATAYLRTAYGTVTEIYGTATIGTTEYVTTAALASSLTLQAGKVYTRSAEIVLSKNTGVATSFAGGDGSASNPFQISNLGELLYFVAYINSDTTSTHRLKCYELTDDIDIGDGSTAWTPISASAGSNMLFAGTFDGKGHTISGKMTCEAGYLGGLFGYVKGGTIKNVNMACTVDGSSVQYNFGAVVGNIYDGKIINCKNTGALTSAAKYVGGVVGYANADSSSSIAISGCTNTGDITFTNTAASHGGGICAYLYTSTGKPVIYGSVNTGSLNASGTNCRLGGITGMAGTSSTTVTQFVVGCWSAAKAITTSTTYTGTIVGQASKCEIISCYYLPISGLEIFCNWMNTSKSTDCDTFTGDAPTTAQIEAMNTAWAAADSARAYRFNATTGEVEENK